MDVNTGFKIKLIGAKELWVSKITGVVIKEPPTDLHRWFHYKMVKKKK